MSLSAKEPASFAGLRTSWLWLALALGTALYTHGNWIVPVAAWFYPFCLLRFTRSRSPLLGFLIAALLQALTDTIWLIVSDIPFTAPFLIVIVFASLFGALPFLFDRLLTRGWHSWASTLLFPLSYVAVSYLKEVANPLGSLGSLAYTQYGNLPLLQLLSVTGISGIVFVMTWFASLGNWALEHRWRWPVIRRGVVLYSALMALIFLGGSLRMILVPTPPTVRIASLSPSLGAINQVKQIQNVAIQHMEAGQPTETAIAGLDASNKVILNDLLTRTQNEASAGAKIVLWPECGIIIWQADEAAFLAETGATARKAGIYLDMGVCVFTQHSLPDIMDQSILLTPQGKVAWTYEKSDPVPGLDAVVPGNGQTPILTTPYGNLTTVVCFDEDFPAMLQRAGRAQAAILLAPSNDWQEIDPWHTEGTTFRAIEEGFALVRETSNGISIAVNPLGQTLAETDYFTTNSQTMVAFVPTQGVETIYARIGDTFSWLCCIGGLALVVVALIARRKRRKVVTQS